MTLAAPPTAALAGSDMQAAGALQAARRRGRSISKQLPVVGYNDNDLAAFFGLTTVSLPLRDLGLQATQHLRAIVADPRPRLVPTCSRRA